MSCIRVNGEIYNMDAVRKIIRCTNGSVVFHYMDRLAPTDVFLPPVSGPLWDRLCREVDIRLVVESGTTEEGNEK